MVEIIVEQHTLQEGGRMKNKELIWHYYYLLEALLNASQQEFTGNDDYTYLSSAMTYLKSVKYQLEKVL